MLKAVIEAKKFAEMNFFNATAATDDESMGRQAFVDGKAAMYMIGFWETGTMATLPNAEDIGYANFPAMNGNSQDQDVIIKHYQDAWCLGSNQTEEQKVALYDFFNFFYSPEQQQFLRDSGVITVTKGDYKADIIGKDYIRMLEVHNKYQNSTPSLVSRFPGELAGPLFELGFNIVVGKADPASELEKVDKAWNELKE